VLTKYRSATDCCGRSCGGTSLVFQRDAFKAFEQARTAYCADFDGSCPLVECLPEECLQHPLGCREHARESGHARDTGPDTAICDQGECAIRTGTVGP
jgi:hypothetical protein